MIVCFERDLFFICYALFSSVVISNCESVSFYVRFVVKKVVSNHIFFSPYSVKKFP